MPQSPPRTKCNESEDSPEDERPPYTSGIILGLYRERPGLHFLSDYDQKISQTQLRADGDVTNEQILEMKAMIRAVKKNPSLIFEKFDLPWDRTSQQKEVSEKDAHKIKDQDISNMKSFVHAAKSDPSLIHQNFPLNLSQRTQNDDINDPFSPNCVTQLAQQTHDQFPKPPLSEPAIPDARKTASQTK